MATRVYELAKELGMGNKEMLSKLNSMGIEVSSHMNAISDKDCLAVRNAVGKSEKGKETKEMKAEQKQQNIKSEDRKGADSLKNERQENNAGAQKKQMKASQNHPKKNQEASSGNAQRKSDRPQSGQQKNAQDRKSQSGQPAKARHNGGSGERRQASGAAKDGRKNDSRRPNTAPSADRTEHSRQTKENRNSKDNRGRGNSGNSGRSDSDKKNNKDRKFNMAKMAKPQHKHKKDHRKEQRKEDARRAEEAAAAIPAGAIIVTVPITVKGLSEQIDVSTSKIIMTLMKMGIMANINQNLDEDTVQILGDELGKQIIIGKVEEEEVEAVSYTHLDVYKRQITGESVKIKDLTRDASNVVIEGSVFRDRKSVV